MIKRDRRNIGKIVRIDYPDTDFHGRLGKVKGFRGDRTVQVYVYDRNDVSAGRGASYPFPGNRLVPVEELNRRTS